LVSLQGLVKTFKISKNPFSTIFLRFNGLQGTIFLRNGSVFRVGWRDFCFLRDNYRLVKKYSLRQVGDGRYLFSTSWGKLVGNFELLSVLEEIGQGFYDMDFSGKTLLDVGGFMGETAVYFLKVCGVKRVVMYEPVEMHSGFIHENFKLNDVSVEVHHEGIGCSDGFVKVRYDKIDVEFGLESGGNNEVTIKVRDVTKVIVESNADVAKFDCEGAEMYLADVPMEVLRRLEYVIVETHSESIKALLEKKFVISGFVMDKPSLTVGVGVAVLYFRREGLVT